MRSQHKERRHPQDCSARLPYVHRRKVSGMRARMHHGTPDAATVYAQDPLRALLEGTLLEGKDRWGRRAYAGRPVPILLAARTYHAGCPGQGCSNGRGGEEAGVRSHHTSLRRCEWRGFMSACVGQASTALHEGEREREPRHGLASRVRNSPSAR